jgi:hypothetical protein
MITYWSLLTDDDHEEEHIRYYLKVTFPSGERNGIFSFYSNRKYVSRWRGCYGHHMLLSYENKVRTRRVK